MSRLDSPHSITLHSFLSVCGDDDCQVETYCVRFTNPDGPGNDDRCIACVKEDRLPEGYTLAMWCSLCTDVDKYRLSYSDKGE